MPGRIGRTPFVGRGRELQQLHAALDVAATGQGQVVLVAGEPGIGKTRLLAEFAEQARSEGWQVLAGQAYDTEGMPPYFPFTEALREFVQSCPLEDLQRQIDAAGPEVVLLAPDIRRRLPDRTAIPPTAPEEQRYRLLESVVDFLIGIPRSAETRGLVLILDDLHWADSSSLLLFQHLARRLRSAPVLLIGAFHAEDVSRDHPLAAILADLRRAGSAERLPLAPLQTAEIEALIKELAGAAPAAAVVEIIERETDGNPFFVTEVVRDLVDRGRDVADPGSSVGNGVPEGVREVIGHRLSRLSAVTNQTLYMSAVLGDGFTFELLAAAADTADILLLDAVDEATSAGILREEDGRFRFGHALIRETLYDSVSQPRRQRLHLRVAEAIERAEAGNLAPYLAELAAHFRLAGPLAGADKAIDYALLAGEAAQVVFAHEDAARQWEAGLALMDAQHVAPERRAELLGRLSDLLYSMGFAQYPQAIAYGERALKLAQETGPAERVADLHLSLGRALNANNAATQNIPGAVAHYRAAQQILEQGPERAALSNLYGGLAGTAVWAAHTEEGLAASRRAMAIAERVGDERRWLSAAVFHGSHLVAAGRADAGMLLLERARDAAESLNETTAGFITAAWRAGRSFELDDPRDAAEWFGREARLPRQAQAASRRQALVSGVICARACSGNLIEAQRLVSEAGSMMFELDAAMFWQPLLAFWSGDWEQAETLWAQARDRHVRTGNRYCQSQFDCWLARVRFVRGNSTGAEAMLQDALAIGIESPLVAAELRARSLLAGLAVEADCPQDAQAHLDRCREILAEREDWRGLAGRVALAEAAAAAADGRSHEAVRYFEQALFTFRSYGLPWDEAETLHRWGRALLVNGDHAAALAKLDAAIAVYRGHGAGEPWIERVLLDRRRADDGVDPDRTPTKPASLTYPDGLTAREVEVLRLIAAGRSSAEIADDLVLSVRTVGRHVTNIYTKIGARGKVDATHYAIEHSLTESPTP